MKISHRHKFLIILRNLTRDRAHSAVFEAPNMEVQRKPRIGGLRKAFAKARAVAIQHFLPVVRYGMIPGLVLFTLTCTEPAPGISASSILELLNPLF